MEQLFTNIQNREVQALLGLFEGGHANVSLPSFGVISNDRVFAMLVEKIARFLSRMNITADYLGGFAGEGRRVDRYRLHYVFRDTEREEDLVYEIPVGIVSDLKNGKITAARIYAAMEYAVGKQILRPAFWPANEAAKAALPESVTAIWPEEGTVAEAGAVLVAKGAACIEENILMIQGDICTPQARLSVYLLDENGQVTARETYGEVVWDFKLWPTLY